MHQCICRPEGYRIRAAGTQARRLFWSIYGRYVWDEQQDPARVYPLPAQIVTMLNSGRTRRRARVLDAGCGTGNYARALAQAGFDVVGMDFAPGMLARAQTKAADATARFALMAADLNAGRAFPDGYFDHVISISVLQTTAQPHEVLHEFRRVLKPGGTLILSLPKRNAAVLTQSLAQVIRTRARDLRRRTPGKILLVVVKALADRYHRGARWTVEDASNMLQAAHFAVLSLDEGPQILAAATRN